MDFAMTRIIERRRLPRKIGHGLAALIDGKAYPVIDISTGGVSFQGIGQKLGARLAMKIARMSDFSDCIDCVVTVKSEEGNVTRGEFLPTMALMRYIIGHIGEATGAEPAYFRK
jgi:hypothetical protein